MCRVGCHWSILPWPLMRAETIPLFSLQEGSFGIEERALKALNWTDFRLSLPEGDACSLCAIAAFPLLFFFDLIELGWF